jgi:hypothetical protein
MAENHKKNLLNKFNKFSIFVSGICAQIGKKKKYKAYRSYSLAFISVQIVILNQFIRPYSSIRFF